MTLEEQRGIVLKNYGDGLEFDIQFSNDSTNNSLLNG